MCDGEKHRQLIQSSMYRGTVYAIFASWDHSYSLKLLESTFIIVAPMQIHLDTQRNFQTFFSVCRLTVLTDFPQACCCKKGRSEQTCIRQVATQHTLLIFVWSRKKSQCQARIVSPCGLLLLVQSLYLTSNPVR